MPLAKVFWSGRSQAVRLPKEFRFDVEEVRIRRHGVSLIIEPVSRDWGWLDELEGPFDEDVVRAIAEPVADQSRPGLDSFE
jgi:antitoxin VapB